MSRKDTLYRHIDFCRVYIGFHFVPIGLVIAHKSEENQIHPTDCLHQHQPIQPKVQPNHLWLCRRLLRVCSHLETQILL